MKKRWLKKKNRINRGISVFLIMMLLPLLVTIVMQNMKLEHLLAGIGQVAWDEEEIESILIGIVAKEICVTAEEETLRAQCVIARTNYLDAKKKGTKEPEGMSLEEMKAVFGEEYETVYDRLKRCVDDTSGEVLMWQGDYVYAAYHAVSNGNTRSMEEMYGDVYMPYLSGVECHEDTTAKGYLAVYFWKKEEFLNKINEIFSGANVTDVAEVQIEQRDAAEYVLKLQVGAVSCSGEEFRSAFGLNSSCFAITDTGENVRVVTKGIGHGFGLSQHMAEVLAKEGKNYQEILAYFFPQTELIKQK